MARLRSNELPTPSFVTNNEQGTATKSYIMGRHWNGNHSSRKLDAS